MKKIFLSGIFLLALGYCSCFAQIPVYPIPSRDVNINGYADFREDYRGKQPLITLEKRGVYVTVNTITPGSQATVWVYSLDRQTVYGPFTVAALEPLYQIIDDRQWGVLMNTDEEIPVSVWIE